MKENGFTLVKARSRRYPAQTIMDVYYGDDITLLANTPAQVESRQHSLERAAGGIGLPVNSDKTEFMCFNQNQRGAISTQNLVDKFTYLGSSISSTENDINTQLAKAESAIDRLLVIWKSDQSNKIKHNFFQATFVSLLLYGWTSWTLTNCMEKNLYWHNPGSNIPKNSSCTATYLPSLKPSKSDMWDTAGGVRTNSCDILL